MMLQTTCCQPRNADDRLPTFVTRHTSQGTRRRTAAFIPQRKRSVIPAKPASLATRLPKGHLAEPRFSSLVTSRLAAVTPSLRLQASSFIPPRKALAFTLIELLVVIAIIAILAGLAFPAVQGALESSRKAQARNDVQQIAAAIRAFELEYGRQPDAQTADDKFFSDNDSVMRALTGQDATLNPRNIRFIEPKTTTGTKGGYNETSGVFSDPWGTPYFIKLNTDYNNVIEYYGNNSVSVIVGSMGPNKKQDAPSGPDDILNFK